MGYLASFECQICCKILTATTHHFGQAHIHGGSTLIAFCNVYVFIYIRLVIYLIHKQDIYRTSFLIYTQGDSNKHRLSTVDGPGEAPEEGAVVVMATEGLPEVKAHVDGVVVAEVAVGDDGGLGDAVALHGNGLAAELVVLCGAVSVKDVGGHGDKGGLLVDVLEVGADAAGTSIAEDVVALRGVAEAVDGAVLVVAAGTLLNLVAGGSSGDGREGNGGKAGEVHCGI